MICSHTELLKFGMGNHKGTSHSADAGKPRDAFGGQSRSPIIVSFDMLCMVSY